MAISDLSSLDEVIINPATGLLSIHPRGLHKNHVLCHISAWYFGIPNELFDEAVRNGEIERAEGDTHRITEKGRAFVEANRYPRDDTWPPPPPKWDD